MLSASKLPPRALKDTIKAFSLLAEAEGSIHGAEPEKVHFHEVGAMDSIIDMAGSCLAMEMLGAEKISVSPLPTGRGRFQMPPRGLPPARSGRRAAAAKS